MAINYHQIQIRAGNGVGIMTQTPIRYSDFENDIIRTAQRVPVISKSEAIRALVEVTRAGEKSKADKDKAQAKARKITMRGRRALFTDAVASPTGLGDMIMMFWLDHFVTSTVNPEKNPLFFSYVFSAIRSNIHRTFYDMLVSTALHPMMVMYLNQKDSSGPRSKHVREKPHQGLNENYARELLELHTLGVGAPYTQNDVRQAALLLTGISFSTWKERDTYFDREREEPGQKTILGRRYQPSSGNNFNHIMVFLRDLSMNKSTMSHVCRKMAIHFCSDQPSKSLILAMTGAWARSGGNLMLVYRAMLSHPEFTSTNKKKIKRPFEYIVSGIRALGGNKNAIERLTDAKFNDHIWGAMNRMGQPMLSSPGPDGWPKNASFWISPNNYANRVKWAAENARDASGQKIKNPVLVAEMALNKNMTPALLTAVSRAPSVKDAVTIMLSSSDFNRR